MSLLQRILEIVEEDSGQNVDLVDRVDNENSPKTTKSTTAESLKINTLEIPTQNVDFVACMRELENHLPPSSSSKNKKINISLARASDKVDKMPEGCPLWTGKYPPNVMRLCRFSKKTLMELISDGVLPLESGCPFVNSCGLVCGPFNDLGRDDSAEGLKPETFDIQAPADCDKCPASGYWDCSEYAGQGPFCFYTTYYLGKPGHPEPCNSARDNCPLTRKDL